MHLPIFLKLSDASEFSYKVSSIEPKGKFIQIPSVLIF